MLRFAMLLLVATSAIGQSAQQFEPVLLPISLVQPVPGAYGSLWATEFWASANAGDVRFLETGGCLSCPPYITIIANKSRSIEFGGFPGQPAGTILYLQRSTAVNGAFNLRIRDLSRQALTWGTELPVVRESRFRTGLVQLTNVPLDDRFRLALRIYDPDAHLNAQFVVHIYDATSGELLAERTLLAQAGRFAGEDRITGIPIVPSVAEVAFLRDAFPELPSTGRVRITISRAGDVSRIWAFVSVTNNETQHVTTITPQE